jgi:hypothetical protein
MNDESFYSKYSERDLNRLNFFKSDYTQGLNVSNHVVKSFQHLLLNSS